jgi:hypothetical protein
MKAQFAIPKNAPAPDQFFWLSVGALGDSWWITDFWTPDGDGDKEVLCLSVQNYRDQISEWDWSYSQVTFYSDDYQYLETIDCRDLNSLPDLKSIKLGA